jgi:hydroxyacylglutathione hydrolase
MTEIDLASMREGRFPGWCLLGQYPVGDPDGVGSWLLHHGGEAALLELPPDEQLIADAAEAVERLGVRVKLILVSHDHEDHFDRGVLRRLRKLEAFQKAIWVGPRRDRRGVRRLVLGGEPLWLIYAPKHSRTDVVTVFRGLAMTGDIELGTVDSVNREVKLPQKRKSLAFLADFERVKGYQIRALISAHLNDFREGIGWASVVAAAA